MTFTFASLSHQATALWNGPADLNPRLRLEWRLVPADHTRRLPLYQPDYTAEDLQAIRALLPADARRPWPDS